MLSLAAMHRIIKKSGADRVSESACKELARVLEKSDMNGISVEGKITDISESRRVQTRYGLRSVADSTLEDETGTIKLSLWEENITRVSIGDNVKINGAYITEFRNQFQLNIPRSGKLEITKQNIIEI
jgi:replication factor A1